MASKIFSFVLCKGTDVINTAHEEQPSAAPCITEMQRNNLEKDMPIIDDETDSSEASETTKNKGTVARFPAAITSWQSPKRSFKKRDNGDILHVSSVHAEFSWSKTDFKDANGVKTLLRKRAKELNKLKTKMCEDLQDLVKFRHQAGTEKNVDTVISEDAYTEGNFIRKFRDVYNEIMPSFQMLVTEFKELINKHSNVQKTKSFTESLPETFQHCDQDNDEFNDMIEKAIKLATIEYKLNECLNSSNTSSKIEDLEKVLLDLQRLKISSNWTFSIMDHNKELFPKDHELVADQKSYTSQARVPLCEMFSADRTSKVEKDAKLRLAELHINKLDIQQQKNCAKFQLSQAINGRVENMLMTSIEFARTSGVDMMDEIVQEAENVLKVVKETTHKCRSDLKLAIFEGDLGKLNSALKVAENLHISGYDSVVMEAKKAARKLQDRTEEYKKAIDELKKAIKLKDYSLIESGLIKAKSIRSRSESNAIDEGIRLLTKLQKSTLAFSDENVEKVRCEIADTLNSVIPEDIARVLIKARVVGLNNCVEVMGGRSRLALLQGDDYRCGVENRKIEEHVHKTIASAESEDGTIGLILTLERAAIVIKKLGLSQNTQTKAQVALDLLRRKKEKIKSIKDELQRSVMECRQEAIQCAISEAESVTYFLTFDPTDGQLAAILEYARKKVNTSKLNQNQENIAQNKLENAKIALKRAMKGRNSKKLKFALSLFRKSVNFDDIIDKTDPIESNDGGCQPAENEEQKLIRKAERRLKRVEKEEQIAEKEWEELKRNLENNLRSALQTNDRPELWKAVHQFKRELGETMTVADKNLLGKATKRLYDVTINQFKTNIQKALSDRDCGRLKHVLNEIDSPSHSILPIDLQKGEFADDIEKARKLSLHLKEMSKIQRSVSEMTRSQIAEIHRYPSPPRFVKEVMKSVYLLLGEPETKVKEWSNIVRLTMKMGRESITRRVGIFTTKRVTLATAHRVNQLLKDMTFQQVKDVSKGAAVFYVWCKCVSAEVVDRNHDPPSLIVVEKKKPITTPKEITNSEFWNRLSRPRSSGVGDRTPRLVRVRQRPLSAVH